MSNERKRKRAEITEKGIPIAALGSEVIWDDLRLRNPFSSNPFISKMKGRAFLEQTLSYGLYYNELTGKWSPITAATMTEALAKARFYASNPDALTELSDNPLRSDNAQNLMVVNKDVPLKATDLEFNGGGKLKVDNDDLETILDKLKYLDTTKLSVKDADILAQILASNGHLNSIKQLTDLSRVKLTEIDTAIDTIDGVLDTIQGQTDKLQFDGSNNLKCIVV